MKRRRLLVAVTLLLVLQAALLPGDVEAHPSSYCGHDVDGYTVATRYVNWRNDRHGHWHLFRHQRYRAWDVHQPVWKLCNGTH